MIKNRQRTREAEGSRARLLLHNRGELAVGKSRLIRVAELVGSIQRPISEAAPAAPIARSS